MRGRGWSLGWLGALGAGAGLMYWFDLQHGARRRALLRDKAVHALRALESTADAAQRDAVHRAEGLVARLRGAWRGAEPIDDEVLVERVRAELGRCVSHPHAIEVTASDGCVVLRGPVLAHEVSALLRSTHKIPGVRGLVSELQEHQTSDGVPALQGGARRVGRRPELLQDSWSPSVRLLGGGAGLLLALAGRRGWTRPLGWGAATLLLRAVTNLPLGRLIGIGAGRHAIDIRKTIDVRAPVDQVWRFWSHYTAFPRIMEHVRDVRATDDGRSHWKVTGPMGLPIEWDAQITRQEDQRQLAWRTLPRPGGVGHTGVVRFDPNPDGSTRVDVRLSYNPPGGALGHLLARLVRGDPRSILDQDLLRMKSLLEDGKATAHHRTVTRDDLDPTIH